MTGPISPELGRLANLLGLFLDTNQLTRLVSLDTVLGICFPRPVIISGISRFLCSYSRCS